MIFFELGDDVVDDPMIKVLATQEGVAIGGEHFELLFTVDIGDLNDRYVKGAAAQVIDGDFAVLADGLVQTEGQCSCGWLIDNALDIQARDPAGVLGRLTLGVVEVGRHGDDGFGDFLAQVVLGGFLHLTQHFGRDLRRGDALVANLDPGIAIVGFDDAIGHQIDVFLNFLFAEFAPDQPLDRVQRVLRIGDRLTFGRRADQDFIAVGVGDDRWRCARTLGVFNHLGLAALHDRDARVGGTQIDANNLSHVRLPKNSKKLGAAQCLLDAA